MKHAFWDTQPIAHLYSENEGLKKEGTIVKVDIKDVATEQIKLPAGFEWSDINLKDEAQLLELSKFLSLYYLYSQDGTFLNDETGINFISWMLDTPTCKPEYILGVRATANQKLMAFIAGIPIKVNAKD